MPRLENWALIAKGEIFDDEKGRFRDGEPIITSKIVLLDGRMTEYFTDIKTLNTEYKLGKPKQFPKELGINE